MAGGAERHIASVVKALRDRGHESFLLFDPDAAFDLDFTNLFDGVFPCAEPTRQIRVIAPDVVYLHQVSNIRVVSAIADSGVAAIRFFHDHEPFCLRGHKYTTLTGMTCARPLGGHCLPCLGPVNRGSGILPIRFRTLGAARKDLAVNMRLDAFAVGSTYMKDHVVAH